jgi:hypothetical protein
VLRPFLSHRKKGRFLTQKGCLRAENFWENGPISRDANIQLLAVFAAAVPNWPQCSHKSGRRLGALAGKPGSVVVFGARAAAWPARAETTSWLTASPEPT